MRRILVIINSQREEYIAIKALTNLGFKWAAGQEPSRYKPSKNSEGKYVLMLYLKNKTIACDSTLYRSDNRLLEKYNRDDEIVVQIQTI